MFSWRNYERQKNFVDKAWARAVNYGLAVFSLTCFVFLVIFVITNLIFQILVFYFKKNFRGEEREEYLREESIVKKGDFREKKETLYLNFSLLSMKN